jgi:transposase-like protein
LEASPVKTGCHYFIVNDLESNRISNDARGSLASHSILSSKLLRNSVPCPRCGSTNIILGAGLKPGEESQRCGDCRFFLGYSPVTRLKKSRKRKELTECLQVLEDSGIQGEIALFILSLADDNGGEG